MSGDAAISAEEQAGLFEAEPREFLARRAADPEPARAVRGSGDFLQEGSAR
jgi:hypothetical protein